MNTLSGIVKSEVVRDRERREGFEEHAIRRLEKVNLTESQRRDAIYYNLGHAVEFHRRGKGGFKSGERWEVSAVQLAQCCGRQRMDKQNSCR
jgi:hypothetical protein